MTERDLTTLLPHIQTEGTLGTITLTGAKDFYDMTDQEHAEAKAELALGLSFTTKEPKR